MLSVTSDGYEIPFVERRRQGNSVESGLLKHGSYPERRSKGIPIGSVGGLISRQKPCAVSGALRLCQSSAE
jgi:hypothetical protein